MIRIHINSKQGMFTVKKYDSKVMHLCTRHYEFTTKTSDFKCLAGGFNNFHNSQELHDFQMVVDPEYIELQQRTDKLLNKLRVLRGEEVDMLVGETDWDNIIQPGDYLPTDEDKAAMYQEEPDEEPFYVDATPPTYEQYQRWYEQEREEHDKLKGIVRRVAREMYKDITKYDFSEFEHTKGTKFIIQSKYSDRNDTRFCFDVYALMDNYHSNISEAFSDQGYGTDNGGWFKVHNKTVVLYKSSGDYGKYDDRIAKEAAEKLFPYHQIYSFSGKEWDLDMDRLLFPESYPIDDDELPF
mgnify:CR=1 FL=1